MKILLPIIALLLVGCGKSPEEMVVGEWKTGFAKNNMELKLRANGVMEFIEGDFIPPEMGEWKIVDGIIETRLEYDELGAFLFFYNIEGPSKLTLFQMTNLDGTDEEVTNFDPPKPFHRVVE